MTEHEQVYVIGLGFHPATTKELGLRLEEMVYHTSCRALDDARVSQRQLDNLVIGACDELDGRPISSMLMTAPAGGYLKDEIKLTDSGASALVLAYARIRSGEFKAGLVSSWCKSSKTDVEAVMRLRADPFFMRPLGINSTVADALFAQAASQQHGISDDEVNVRVHDGRERASANPRGLRARVPSREAIAATEYLATPLRSGQVAPLSDGAISIVICGAGFLRANPQCRVLARIAGVGWATDSYRLSADRLGAMASARKAWSMALEQSGLQDASDLQAFEIESPTGWHEAAYVRAFDIPKTVAVSPSGGAFAQNPIFCTGLVNAAEAILQVAGRAGPVQVQGVLHAAAHGCHGYAQQGNVVAIFEKAERPQ
jgi:acetyl-CoA acetyltransferase